MDGRSTTIALGLALAATALSGCIQNPDWLNNASAEVSALENKGLADDAAAAWSEDAVLVGAMAFELSEAPDPRIDSDPDPGNGLAPAWWYVYCDASMAQMSAEGEASSHSGYSDDGGSSMSRMESMPMLRAFKVTSDGEVSSEKDAEAFASGFDHEMVTPMGEWTVDSDEALAAAKTDESFAKVAQGFNASVVEGIANYEGETAWWVSAMSADGFVVATVDALTGELTHVESIDMDFEMPDFEWGAANPEMTMQPVHLEGEGVASAGDEPAEFPFTTGGAPMSGSIWIDYGSDAPIATPEGGLWWAIVDEEGNVYDDGRTGGFGFGPSGSHGDDVNIDDVEGHDLVLVIGASSWVPMSPLASDWAYTFTLDLYPPGMEPDEESEP